jgi:hypothetical protein
MNSEKETRTMRISHRKYRGQVNFDIDAILKRNSRDVYTKDASHFAQRTNIDPASVVTLVASIGDDVTILGLDNAQKFAASCAHSPQVLSQRIFERQTADFVR